MGQFGNFRFVSVRSARWYGRVGKAATRSNSENRSVLRNSSDFLLQISHRSIGFFYIVNFGLSQEAVDRQFSIGKELFTLSTDEKLKYRADLEHGGYNGYKPLGLRVSLSMW